MSGIPTPDQVMAAENYALSRMCVSLPKQYNSQNLTQWDATANVCTITPAGCNPFDASNPITQVSFDRAGNEIDPTFGNPRVAPFWKYWTPTMLAYKSVNGGPMACRRANDLLYNWCDNPRGRSNKTIPGVTNAAPFEYTVQGGKETCKIPKTYCDDRGVSYDAKNQNCYVSTGQGIAEFFASATAVRMSNRSSDPRLKDSPEILKKDFMPGIHVYLFQWNREARQLYGLTGPAVGFMATEVPKQYVSTDDNGYMQINIMGDDDFSVKARIIYGLNNLLNKK